MSLNVLYGAYTELFKAVYLIESMERPRILKSHPYKYGTIFLLSLSRALKCRQFFLKKLATIYYKLFVNCYKKLQSKNSWL